MEKILFVDDSAVIRNVLSKTLAPLRSRWELEFVSSGAEALERLALEPFAAVVSDMQMPEMTGVQLLDKVRDKFPQTIRIVVSGTSDTAAMLQIMTSAHQSLPKPCDIGQLQSVLEKTTAITGLLNDVPVKAFISRLTTIPSLPVRYQMVAHELRSKDPSPKRIGEIISKDMAMTAKLLQMANSAVHGVRIEVTGPEQAVLVLGLDTIQSMLLSLSIFSVFDKKTVGFATKLWNDSFSVSEIAVECALAEGIKPREIGPYQSAGILHDIGKLVMVSGDPNEYRRIEKLAISTGRAQYEVEKETLGCGHPEIGAYLLGLWGLPTSIVEAVAWHHNPSESPASDFGPLAAVHVACVLNARSNSEVLRGIPSLDQGFLKRIHMSVPQEGWNQEQDESLTEAMA